MYYSFQYTSLELLLVNLFLIILSFLFLISFSHCLLAYKSIIYSHTLILYSVILLNLFNYFGQILCRFFRTFYIQVIPSSNDRDSFVSSFLTWTPFISFYCLTVLSRTSRIRLTRICESGYPCFTHDLKGKAFSLLTLSIMSAGAFRIYRHKMEEGFLPRLIY